jgi:hypothetical protein
MKLNTTVLLFIGFLSAVPIGLEQTGSTPAPPPVESIIGLSISSRDVQLFLAGIRASTPEQSAGSDGDYYRTYKLSGVSLLCSRDDRIVTVFLYSVGQEGYAQFRYPLPRGITFQDDRASTSRKLGLPNCAGGGENGVLGPVSLWDTWSANWGTLHVTYKTGGKIGLVTLMIPSRDPGCRGRG